MPGLVGLASGLIGLAALSLGVDSWMICGGAFSIWCFSGWRLYFSDANQRRYPGVLGKVFLSTGILVAGAVAIRLYLLALGPAWIL